jgi:hypothetical protein
MKYPDVNGMIILKGYRKCGTIWRRELSSSAAVQSSVAASCEQSNKRRMLSFGVWGGWLHIPYDGILLSHRRENLKSHKVISLEVSQKGGDFLGS